MSRRSLRLLPGPCLLHMSLAGPYPQLPQKREYKPFMAAHLNANAPVGLQQNLGRRTSMAKIVIRYLRNAMVHLPPGTGPISLANAVTVLLLLKRRSYGDYREHSRVFIRDRLGPVRVTRLNPAPEPKFKPTV
ncbi:hypothetical protein EDD85DRAFT_793558 [Armillaria nabsnona]|nr:hypothetical protein EDD85DRAFT_793558 [Armillaria nabsnona]